MFSRTLSWLTRSAAKPTPARQPAPAPRFRPTLDTLEDRTVLSVTPLVNLPIDVGTIKAVTDAQSGVQTLQAPVLLAGQQAGTLVMNATTGDASANGDCPVLHLEIQPIHLNLLGLQVDTSAICLDITAQHNQGILGELLCGLSANQTLSQILTQLGSDVSDLNTVLTGIENLLDGGPLANQVGVLDQTMSVTGLLNSAVNGGSTPQTPPAGTCNILNLAVGPVDLNLLGLNVELDNCGGNTSGGTDGPVTVDITGVHDGAGSGLLGDLLCGVADGLSGLSLNRLIGRLDHLIDSIGNLADRLDEIADLPDRFEALADRLVDQIVRVADKVDSLADLDRLVRRIDRVVTRLDRLIDNTDISSRLLGQLNTAISQLTRIINRYTDLGFVDRVSGTLERVIDRLFASL